MKVQFFAQTYNANFLTRREPILILRRRRASLTLRVPNVQFYSLKFFQVLVPCKLLAKTVVCSRSSIAEGDTQAVPA